MSQQANLVLNNVTYVPAGNVKPGIVTWIDRSAGVQSGFSVFTQKASLADTVRKTNKFEYRLAVPVIETTSDTCACSGDVLRTSGGGFSFYFAPGATLSERTDTVQRLIDALTAVKDSIINLDPSYA